MNIMMLKFLLEGDIVKINSIFAESNEKFYIVEWVKEWSGLGLRTDEELVSFDYIDSDEIEIVGNIYDNQGLLKEV